MDGLNAVVRDREATLDRLPAQVTLRRVARLAGVGRDPSRFDVEFVERPR
jgi:hypothetical protein